MNSPALSYLLSALLGASLLLTGGCGQKEEEAAAVDETPAVEETPAEETTADASAEESTTDSVVIEVDSSLAATPQQYDQAMQAQDYVQAADVVLRMNAQNVQGANVIDRMRQLQDEVARAAYGGDPKAQQAAEMLRRIGRLPPPSQ